MLGGFISFTLVLPKTEEMKTDFKRIGLPLNARVERPPNFLRDKLISSDKRHGKGPGAP